MILSACKLLCPVCGALLQEANGGSVARCNNGHCFDRAAEGYFNLTVKAGQSDSGDPPETVAARRAFFSHPSEYYSSLNNAVTEIVGNLNIPAGSVAADACCGEGYFTRRLAAAAREKGVAGCCAFDLSKKAVKIAAKLDRETQYFTSNIASIPIADGSAGLLTHIFAPVCENEFKRILADDGFFVRVIPGKRHLWQIKSTLYENPYENDEATGISDDFICLDKVRISAEIVLDNDSLKNLILMTPYSFRTKKSAVEHLLEADEFTTETEFVIIVYKKRLS